MKVSLEVREHTRIVGRFEAEVDHDNRTLYIYNEEEWERVTDIIEETRVSGGLHIYEEADDVDMGQYTITT